jgi:hypothetical protein
MREYDKKRIRRRGIETLCEREQLKGRADKGQ